MNSFIASAHGHRIGLWEFAIVLKLKNKKKIPAGKCNGCKWECENPENVPLLFLFGFFLFSFFYDSVIAIRCMWFIKKETLQINTLVKLSRWKRIIKIKYNELVRGGRVEKLFGFLMHEQRFLASSIFKL